jgi:hypothetical protein
LELLKKGLSHRQIADQLHTTPHIVYSHKSRLIKKGLWLTTTQEAPQQLVGQSTQPVGPAIITESGIDTACEAILAVCVQARRVPGLVKALVQLTERQAKFDTLVSTLKDLEQRTGN